MAKEFDEVQRREIAYVMINCECGSEPHVFEELKTVSEISEIAYTMGKYDIILKIDTDSVARLREIIGIKIRRMEKIMSTTTVMCMDTTFPPLLVNSNH